MNGPPSTVSSDFLVLLATEDSREVASRDSAAWMIRSMISVVSFESAVSLGLSVLLLFVLASVPSDSSDLVRFRVLAIVVLEFNDAMLSVERGMDADGMASGWKWEDDALNCCCWDC